MVIKVEQVVQNQPEEQKLSNQHSINDSTNLSLNASQNQTQAQVDPHVTFNPTAVGNAQVYQSVVVADREPTETA